MQIFLGFIRVGNALLKDAAALKRGITIIKKSVSGEFAIPFSNQRSKPAVRAKTISRQAIFSNKDLQTFMLTHFID